MNMKRLIAIWMMILCLTFAVVPGQAVRNAADLKPIFRHAVETLYPDWTTTWVSVFSTNRTYVELLLMRVEDESLLTLMILADADHPDGTDWSVSAMAPIPLTEAGVEAVSARLATFDPEAERIASVDALLRDGTLPNDCPQFLISEGETVSQLIPYEDYLLAIVRGTDGRESMRMADWNGESYGPVLATPMFEFLSYIDVHSGYDSMELFCRNNEVVLNRDADGCWRLVCITADEGGRYFVHPDGLVNAQAREFEPYCSNDGWHYGTPTFAVTLPEIDFDHLPDLEDAVPLLDAEGWACVKTERAAFYDAQEGKVLASCFCRLPGRVLSRDSGWTQLQIGTEALGLKGWFRTEDLAFGTETEDVICSFPGYDFFELEDTPLAAEICRSIEEDFYSLDIWLIGQTPAGDWLALVDQKMVCSIPAELISETWPTQHEWDESTWQDWM